jgi:hypothetical protein
LAEVVGFEPTAPFGTSVFKTAALNHAQPYFLKLVPRAGVEPAFKFLFLRETTLPICLPGQKEKLQRKSYALEVEAVLFGATGEIRTHGFTDLQSVALGHSATVALLVLRKGIDPSSPP